MIFAAYKGDYFFFLNHEGNVSFGLPRKLPSKINTFFCGLFVKAEVGRSLEAPATCNRIFLAYFP